MSEDYKKIDLSYITPEEQGVLLLLEKMGKCLYGNIFQELKIAHTKGAEIILSLTNKGYIKNVGRSSYYELNVSLK